MIPGSANMIWKAGLGRYTCLLPMAFFTGGLAILWSLCGLVPIMVDTLIGDASTGKLPHRHRTLGAITNRSVA